MKYTVHNVVRRRGIVREKGIGAVLRAEGDR